MPNMEASTVANLFVARRFGAPDALHTDQGRNFESVVLTLSLATEQYCAAGAILKPLCLSKQLTLCRQQHIDQLFLGHTV